MMQQQQQQQQEQLQTTIDICAMHDPSNNSTMNCYNTAIRVNNLGTESFEVGDFEMAHLYFKMALDMMTHLLITSNHHQQDNCHCQYHKQSHQVWIAWSQIPQRLCHQQQNLLLVQEEESKKCAGFVYRRALKISSSFLLPNNNNDHQKNEYDYETIMDMMNYQQESAAIVYNLALVYHLIGLELNRSEALVKALEFYNIAHGIREQQQQTGELSPSWSNTTLMDLALYNNMGQIQYEMCNYDAASHWFEAVAQQLISCGHYLEHLLSCHDTNGFTLNCIVQQPHLAPAA